MTDDIKQEIQRLRDSTKSHLLRPPVEAILSVCDALEAAEKQCEWLVVAKDKAEQQAEAAEVRVKELEDRIADLEIANGELRSDNQKMDRNIAALNDKVERRAPSTFAPTPGSASGKENYNASR